MSNQLTVPGELPAHLAAYVQNQQGGGDLAANISAGFQQISVRGKVFRIKSGDQETPITDAQGQPLNSINVVIVRANPNLSKTFYEAEFQEGSGASPDCASENGITPDASVQQPQHTVCATCPKNQWGSATSKTTGKPIKACQDSKRVAVIAEGHPDTPYLLNIPAASLKFIATYDTMIRKHSRVAEAVVTQVSFDIDAAYPLLKFKYIRDLSAEEFNAVMDLHNDYTVESMIGLNVSAEAAPAAAPAPVAAPVAPPAAAPAPVAAPVAPARFGQAPVQLPAAIPQRATAAVESPAVAVEVAAPQTTGTIGKGGVDLATIDKMGVVWDERIHSSSQKMNTNGVWAKRRGLDDATFNAVIAELKGQTIPPATTAPAPAAAPAATPAAPSGFGRAPAAPSGFGGAPAPAAAPAAAPVSAHGAEVDEDIDGLDDILGSLG